MRGRETSMCGCLLCNPYWGPGLQPSMCPDWESNWQSFGSQAGAQFPEPHQPGRPLFFALNGPSTFLPQGLCLCACPCREHASAAPSTGWLDAHLVPDPLHRTLCARGRVDIPTMRLTWREWFFLPLHAHSGFHPSTDWQVLFSVALTGTSPSRRLWQGSHSVRYISDINNSPREDHALSSKIMI